MEQSVTLRTATVATLRVVTPQATILPIYA